MKQTSLSNLLTPLLAELSIASRRGTLKTALLGIAVILMAFPPTPSNAQEWTGNVQVLAGTKALDKEDWGPLEDQEEFGILVDFKKEGWPVSVAIDILRSEESSTVVEPLSGLAVDATGETTEVDLGVRKIWDRNGKARPYIGGGLALISADLSARAFGIEVSNSGDAEGLWLDAGVYWTLRESFNIGLDLRYSQADVTLMGTDGNAGGTHAGLVFGYHW